MVLEAFVASLLNKSLGEFVENLNRSQLRIGVWHGDVELQDLKIRKGVLDEMDMPMKGIYGNLGRLVMKIPWKSIYSSPVVLRLEHIHLVASSAPWPAYNAEEAERLIREAKLAELKRYEMSKTKTAQNQSESLLEKLTLQIFRNLQVFVEDVHIRFEDNRTKPGAPFAFGFTLHSLNVQTSDVWESEEVDNLMYKEVSLNSIALYWNSVCPAASSDPREELTAGVASASSCPPGYRYMLGPLTIPARLRISRNLSNDVPKMTVRCDLEKFGIHLSSSQLNDQLALFAETARLRAQVPYRHLRPSVPVCCNAEIWWNFAYECILENEVRRRRNNWSWARIRAHRKLLQEYKNAYTSRVSGRSGNDIIRKMSDLENSLDAFNIILIRRYVDSNLSSQSTQARRVSSKTSSRLSRDHDLDAQLNKAMTAAEKAKLKDAVGEVGEIDAGACNLDANVHFTEFSFHLTKKSTEVYSLVLGDVNLKSLMHEATMSAEAVIGRLNAFGSQRLSSDGSRMVPTVIEPRRSSPIPVFKCNLEMNPQNIKCDSKIHIFAMPLRIVHDDVTINKMIEVFKINIQTSIPPIDQILSFIDIYFRLMQFQHKQ